MKKTSLLLLTFALHVLPTQAQELSFEYPCKEIFKTQYKQLLSKEKKSTKRALIATLSTAIMGGLTGYFTERQSVRAHNSDVKKHNDSARNANELNFPNHPLHTLSPGRPTEVYNIVVPDGWRTFRGDKQELSSRPALVGTIAGITLSSPLAVPVLKSKHKLKTLNFINSLESLSLENLAELTIINSSEDDAEDIRLETHIDQLIVDAQDVNREGKLVDIAIKRFIRENIESTKDEKHEAFRQILIAKLKTSAAFCENNNVLKWNKFKKVLFGQSK